ncbi:MAG: hypothetical protein QOE38_983 [Thermoleophilaceae bacterium]|jgi:hypothetical protein|nr:hypothetical protein [Thermoleophilaceae bacterium]
MLTPAEDSALRKVAGVMTTCSADLPSESVIGNELAAVARRLLAVVGRNGGSPVLTLVGEPTRGGA